MTDDPELLTIGDFARAVGLPTSALRHYDECGLLVPARTDASTGFGQNVAVLVAVAGLGVLADAAGLRPALALVVLLLLATAALPLPVVEPATDPREAQQAAALPARRP